jgi:hypothetical protein
MLEDVDIPFLLKDAPIVDVHVELPMVGKTVNVQRGVFGILCQKAELLIELSLDAFR